MDAPILAESFLTSLFSGLNGEHKFVLLLILFGCITGMVIAISVSVAKAWESVRRRETEMELVRDLLDQGKSAEEIEKIVHPSPATTRSTALWVGSQKSKA